MSGTLLVPLDGSDLAEKALPYAVALGHALDADVHLLSALTADAEQPAALLSPGASLSTAVERTLRESMQRYLDERVDEISASGVRVTALIVGGEPVRAIHDAAAAAAVRMVILATHGRGGLERALLGSVADQVLRTSVRPALVIAPVSPTHVPPPIVLQRLLVPLDGSDEAEVALPVAIEIATACWAALTLERVVPFLPHPGPQLYPLVPRVADEEKRLCSVATDYLETVRRRVPVNLDVQTIVSRGAASDQLVTAAQQHDLVVMTSRGRGGLARAVFGSVADRLVRAAVPVLLVPSPPTVPGPVN